MNGVKEYRCLCSNGFKGTNCEEKIDWCSPNPCLNDGECTQYEEDNGTLSFRCRCKEGANGQNWLVLLTPFALK